MYDKKIYSDFLLCDPLCLLRGSLCNFIIFLNYNIVHNLSQFFEKVTQSHTEVSQSYTERTRSLFSVKICVTFFIEQIFKMI